MYNNDLIHIITLHRGLEILKLEYIDEDPKDGELYLGRIKPGETLVEVRRDANVQIARRI